MVQTGLGKKCENAKGARNMAEEAEHLLSMHEALSSNPCTTQKKYFSLHP
jgi:hypothetical protein